MFIYPTPVIIHIQHKRHTAEGEQRRGAGHQPRPRRQQRRSLRLAPSATRAARLAVIGHSNTCGESTSSIDYTYLSLSLSIYIYIHISIFLSLSLYIYIYMYIHMYVYTYIHMYVCMCVIIYRYKQYYYYY